MPHLSGVSPQAVSLPKGGGDLRGLGGAFVADYNCGTGSYTLDLRLPNGPAGLRPALALAYNSGASNGAFGLGWSLGVPSIHRDGERRFVRYDDTDGYRHDLHGELVRLADGSYRPKRDEIFARIERGDHWEILPKEGGAQRFGIDADAVIAHPEHPDRVLAWALQEAEDRNGQLIRYRYLADHNNLFLKEIRYGPYRLVLTYEPRPDVFGTARHGFPIETVLRCSAIEIHRVRPAGASLIRRYALSYTEPDETPVSLLHQVRLTGHRDDEVESLPPLTFGYTSFRPPDGRCRALKGRPGADPVPLGAPGVDLVDCTGDGLPDLVQIDGTQHRYWANHGDGTFDAPRRIRSLPGGVHLGAPGTGLGDLDGDGAVDVLVADGPAPGFFPRTGQATWGRFRRYRRAPAYSLNDPHNRLVDLDADGRVDLLRTTPAAFVLHLNRGTDGWEALPPIPRVRDLDVFPDVSLADPRVHLADMTGDGLADIVLVKSGEVSYWPYEGLGRWGRRRVLAHSPAFVRPTRPRHVFMTDVNGDGVADLVVVDAGTVTIWINRFGAAFADPVRLRNTPPPGGAELGVADMLGSGTAGVLWGHREHIRPDTRYLYLDLAGERKPYLLTTVDNGLGKKTTVGYRSSSRFAAQDRRSGRPWETFLPFPVQVVAEIRQEDPLAGPGSRLEIRYHDGLYDGDERRFAGFGGVDLIEHGDSSAPGLLTTMRFDTTPTAGLDRDDRALAVARWGKLLDMRQQALDGPVLRSSATVWTATVADHGLDGTPVVTVHRAATRSEAPATSGEPVVVEHAYDVDERGNVVRDRSTANGDRPLALTGETEFARRPDGSPTSLPARLVETRDDGTVVRETRTYYDGPAFAGLPLGRATSGRVTRHSVRVLGTGEFDAHYGPQGLTAASLGYRIEDGAVWADACRYAYDARANLSASRDPLGHETTISYDPDGVFPTRVENPAGHVTRLSWDDAALQPEHVVDPNGSVTRCAFDALGRVTRLALPGDSLDDPSERVVYHLGDLAPGSPPYTELRQKLGTGTPPACRRTYYNGSGEAQQVRSAVDGSTVLVSAREERNARGWNRLRGDPTFADSLDFGPAPGTATTVLRYDAIGRVVATDLPGGRSTRVVHDGFRTVGYDANDTDDSPENIARGFFDTPTTYHLDGWGRLVGVDEQHGTTTHDGTTAHHGTTTHHGYRYDEGGRLVEAVGPDGERIVAQSFDQVGNRLVLDHRDAGLRRFYFDAAGRTVRSVDAAGARVDTSYDALDRPTATSADGVLVHRYVYDATDLPHGVGRLCAVHDESGDWTFEYDARGRTTRRTLNASGRSWTLEHRYDANGRVAGIRYPDGFEAAYRYNRAGQLVAIPGALDEATFDALGRRTSLRFANGVSTHLTYSPSTHFLDRLRVVGPGGEPLHDTTYRRDRAGNVLAQIDGLPPGPGAPHSRRFVLDARYRLLEAAGGGSPSVPAYVREYAYDAAGNIRRYPTHGAAPIEYDPPGSNRIAGIRVDGAPVPLYRHDANGNIVHLPGRDLGYDAFGRLAHVRRSDGARVEYRCNAAGERVWRTGTLAGTTRRTLFLAGLYEEDDDGTVRRYLSAGGTPLAVDRAAGRTYLHGNELGHVVVTTDAAGALAATRFFHPFGEAGPATGPGVPPQFGGRTLDDISGLYHFGARHYAPEIGRFTSPDPLYLGAPSLAVSSPQCFNLYAYGANNPVVYADPSGLSLLGSVLGGLIGGLAGAVTFVVSAGNPFLAGLVGGLAGGAVAGGIDGGAKGAVIGGLLGGFSGAIGGLAVWGISAASVMIGGHVMQQAVMSVLTGLSSLPLIAGVTDGLALGNWDMVAAAAAGAVGSWLGTMIANRVMMTGFWTSGDNPRQIRQAHQMFSERARGTADISRTGYVLDRVGTGAPAFEYHGVVTFREKASYGQIGDDYLEYLHTHAHELGHALQEKTYQGPFPDFDAAWADSVGPNHPWGTGANNPFQMDADDRGRRLMNFSPYPYQTYTLVVAPSVLAISVPTSYENRKSGEDFWRDLDRSRR
ncbi:toxin TcdB middle/N-terminal domain-containing protein [Streptomyces sp. NPDC005805]|uniref:toxin TcdB middle/N-terminal domain-containing protein n=1 Tax=Streptomyces sp. NPDC005805 TaxID=3157068 RepID=UPI0033D380BA